MIPAPTITTSALSRMRRLYSIRPVPVVATSRMIRAAAGGRPEQEGARMMPGRMMDFPLTLTHLLERARSLFGRVEIVSRLPDRSLHRISYEALHRRTAKLAGALARMGVRHGDRVATLAWNHSRHLELYLGVPAYGA